MKLFSVFVFVLVVFSCQRDNDQKTLYWGAVKVFNESERTVEVSMALIGDREECYLPVTNLRDSLKAGETKELRVEQRCAKEPAGNTLEFDFVYDSGKDDSDYYSYTYEFYNERKVADRGRYIVEGNPYQEADVRWWEQLKNFTEINPERVQFDLISGDMLESDMFYSGRYNGPYGYRIVRQGGRKSIKIGLHGDLFYPEVTDVEPDKDGYHFFQTTVEKLFPEFKASWGLEVGKTAKLRCGDESCVLDL